MSRLLHYVVSLNAARITLWCYLIWYLVTVAFHFDAAPSLWLSAFGISVVVGIALLLGVRAGGSCPDRWQVTRLFITPFCVSSFSSLIKGQGFIVIVSPRPLEVVSCVVACAGFVLLVAVAKRAVVSAKP